jgi:hypothetical protein
MLSSLAPILVSLGAPILGSILRTNVGGIAGEASAQVVEALAQAFGAQPTPEAVKAAIEADPKAATKVQAIERERSAEWVAYLTMATSQRDRMLDREDQRGSVFSWGWRPARLLLFLWSWNGVILPVVNATAGASIVPIPWEHLLGFAGLWLAIYGGGHTIKSVLGASSSSWRS